MRKNTAITFFRLLALLTAVLFFLTACGTEPLHAAAEHTLPDAQWGTQTLANGDSFYTPSAKHCVFNTEKTVLYYNNLLLVFTETDLSAEEMEELARSVDGKAMGMISGAIHAFQIMVPDSPLEELYILADTLMENQEVLYACCEYPVQIMGTEADDNPWTYDEPPLASRGNEDAPDGNDWWAEAVGAYTAWAYADLCQEVRIGIVDNGFWAEHEDLIGQINFISNDAFNTAAAHGTQVAGIIGAVNNDIGIRGIADTAKLYCADLWPTDSPDSYHTLAEYLAAVNFMAQSGVCVINNSWGCIVPSQEDYIETVCQGNEPADVSAKYHQWLERRVNHDLIPTAEAVIVMVGQLIDSGCKNLIHVQAAGNSATDARYNGFFSAVTEKVYSNMAPSVLDKLSAAGITYQMIDERILVVGAVQNNRDPNGNYTMSTYSNYGSTVDICAPGDLIFCTIPSAFGFYYGAFAGTSLAAPMVTASVGFLWSLDPALSAAQLRQILLSSTQFQAIGFGHRYPMLNIGAAVESIITD